MALCLIFDSLLVKALMNILTQYASKSNTTTYSFYDRKIALNMDGWRRCIVVLRTSFVKMSTISV